MREGWRMGKKNICIKKIGSESKVNRKQKQKESFEKAQIILKTC